MTTLSEEMTDLTESTLRKLNEFVDHFKKLHETLDDHEHCLRHHAEEIENRGTKYDMLVCRSSIDRCAAKDDVKKDLIELQKAITMHSNKLESLGMTGPGSPKSGPGHRNSNNSLRAGRQVSG